MNTSQANEVAFGANEGRYVSSNCVPSVSGSWVTGGATGNNWDGANGGAGITGSQVLTLQQTGSAFKFTGTDTSSTCHEYPLVWAYK
jgi:hypothetical protein